MLLNFDFHDRRLDGFEAFRRQVRDALAADPAAAHPFADPASRADPAFSLRLGAMGLLGLTWPVAYGGQARTALERFIVLEELLAGGFPVGAHWIAERQVGPGLLRVGSEHLKTMLTPAIARGELYVCAGLSEPDTGSDLASVRMRATRVEKGWRLEGRKTWTSGAHLSHYMLTLCRTDPSSQRHEGLSQLLVAMNAPGVSITPIHNIAGEHEFNEVLLDGVFVPDEMLVGLEGAGWAQITSELALERSGPERYMSCVILLRRLLQSQALRDALPAATVGELFARLSMARSMSISVASMLDAGRDPNLEAAVAKDLGAALEQDIVDAVLNAVACDPDPTSAEELSRLIAGAVLRAPSFSIRGGSAEILRGIVARGLGLR